MLLTWGTVFAIFLSFIGMYALSAYSVEKRIKEIGVRKVLGSSSKEVMFKLLYDILKWVFWSMPFAFLMSFLVMRRWLNDFANIIDLNLLYFLAGGAIALLIAIIAISIKSFAAANRNPVDSLRDE
jgi:putative ABC transport system permease protein